MELFWIVVGRGRFALGGGFILRSGGGVDWFILGGGGWL